MSVRTDVINLSVNVNGNQAQNQLNDLKKKAADLAHEMEGLSKETTQFTKLQKEIAGMKAEMTLLEVKATSANQALQGLNKRTNEYKEAAFKLKTVNDEMLSLRLKILGTETQMKGLKKSAEDFAGKKSELKSVTDEMDNLKKKIGITSLNIKELGQERRRLTAIFNQQEPLSKNFKDYEAQLQKVIARQYELQKSTKAFSQAGQEAGSSFSKVLQTIAQGFTSFFAIQKIIDLVKEFTIGSIEEFNQSEEAVLGLHQALENVGRLDVFEGLLRSADEFAERYKRLDNDDITNVFTKLVDYGKLTQSQIKQTTETIIEYAAKQRISLSEATDVITKSFEGNAKGLKTYGINIKDATTFTERYNLVNGQLYDKIKGTEAALESTNKGAWEKFKQNIRNIQEDIGRFISSLTNLEKQQTETAIEFKKEGESAQALVARYEELSKKVNKTAADKNELTSVTAGLVSIFGSSILQINRETGALDLNVSATKDLIKQKLLLANGKAAEVAAKYNKAVEDENAAIEKQKLLYKALGEQKDAVNNQSPEAIRAKAVNRNIKSEDFGALDESKLSGAEKGVLNLVNELNQFRLAKRKASEDIQSLGKQLEELGFKRDDVDKLFNPKVPANTVVGSGDPDAEQNKKAAKDAERQYDQLLKQAESFQKKLEGLKFRGEESTKSQNEKELDDVRHAYDEILKEYDELVKKLHGKDKTKLGTRSYITLAEEQEINALIEKQRQSNFEKQQKELSDNLTASYKKQLSLSAAFYEEEKNEQAKRYVDGQIDKLTYEANIAHIDVAAKEEQLKIAEDFSKSVVTINGKEVLAVVQSAEDVTKLKKEQLEKQTKDFIAAYAAQEAERKVMDDLRNRGQEAKIETKITIAKSSNDVDGTFDAEQEMRAFQRKKKLEALEQDKKDKLKSIQETGVDGMAAELLIQTGFRQQIDTINADADAAEIQAAKDKRIAKIEEMQKYAEGAFQAATAINGFFNQLENNRLQKEISANDKKKASLQKQLNGKLISQAQYNLKTEELDQDLDKKKKALAREQAKRDKMLNVFSAIVSTAAAIAKALPNIPLSIIAGIVGAAQIATIIATPLPELGKGDWLREGPKHKDKEKGTHVLIERDEAVMSANAMTDKNVYSVTGTTAQITSALNSKNGGVNWAGGAAIQMPKWRIERPASINPNMPRIMEQGGVVRALPGNGNDVNNSELIALLKENNNLLATQIDETKKQKDRLHAVVSHKEFRESEVMYERAKKASGV